MSRFGKTERTIFIAALLALLMFSYFLYDDSLLFPKKGSQKQELIGKVVVSSNDVRRKNSDTFSWLPASKQDQIYQNDSIYTGDRSKAQVQLSSGSVIDVAPNSLVMLNIKNGQMNLDLRYGNFEGNLAQGETLIIKSGNETFELQGSQNSRVELVRSPSGRVDFKLLSGDVRFINRKKQSAQRLQLNSSLSLGKDGALKHKEVPRLQINGPEVMNVVRFNPDDPIPFSWSTSQGQASSYQIEISPSQDFSSVSVEKISQDQKVSITDALPAGHYHWRVKALDSQGKVSAISSQMQMRLSYMQTPQIVSPTPLSELANKGLGAEVRWQASPLLKKFSWQVSTDPDFHNIISENETPKHGVQTPRLNAGTYWVRVKGEADSRRSTPWSTAVPFNLKDPVVKKTSDLERPILITKNIKFIPPGKDRNPASPHSPQIAWKPVLKTSGYQVEISKNPSFRGAEKHNVASTDILWSKYRPGSYYFRVFAKDSSGALSLPSETGTMIVDPSKLYLNPLRTIVNTNQGPVEAPVTWSEVPEAASYIVQFDNHKTFESPVTFNYKSNSGKIKLPEPGRYNVRVQAKDAAGQPISEFSNVEQILYAGKSLLLQPKPLEPFNQASIFLQKNIEPYLWLEWQQVKGATGYRVEISDTADFSRILLSETTPGNRFLIKKRVPLGKLFWRVRAESPTLEDFSDWAEKREFTLYQQKNETFIK